VKVIDMLYYILGLCQTVLNLSVYVRLLPNSEENILKMNEVILMQIGKGMKRLILGVRRSKIKIKGGC